MGIRKFFKNRTTKVGNYFKRKADATLARAEGYAEGTDETAKKFLKQVKELTSRISTLTDENLKMEQKLRGVYDERVDVLDNRYTKKCKECMRVTDKERERLRKDQNAILDLIQNFNIVYMKLFKHANLVIDEHDNIIKSSGRVKASRDMLLDIRVEANDIVKKALPLLGIEVTEKTEKDLLLSEEIKSVTKNSSKDRVN